MANGDYGPMDWLRDAREPRGGDKMKVRKVIVTLELLTNVKLKDLSKLSMQDAMDAVFDEGVIVQQVTKQVVKQTK